MRKSGQVQKNKRVDDNGLNYKWVPIQCLEIDKQIKISIIHINIFIVQFVLG